MDPGADAQPRYEFNAEQNEVLASLGRVMHHLALDNYARREEL